MIAAIVALAGCVFVLGHLAGPLLLRRRWIAGQPGTAVAVWSAAAAGAFLALMGLIGLALVWPSTPGHRLIDWLANCLPKEAHKVSVSAAIATALLLAAAVSSLRLAIPRVLRTVRERRRHREMLDMVASDLSGVPDIRVLDHPLPLVYCLPTRERPIVVTTGALDQLEPAEIEAVLEHERAHLRQRHHLMLMLIDTLRAALPWLGTLRAARTTLPGLLELAADDSAARRHGAAPLIGALQKLAIASCSAGALAGNPASSEIAELRIARLKSPHALPRLRHPRPISWMAVTTALGVPAATVIVGVTMLPMPC